MSTPYLGSKISLISRLDIRYEGILYTVDSNESTIALAKVRSFGTENRPTERPVKARDEVYEYIIFKASDIKDLVVCEGPKESEPDDVDYDPAIVSVSKPPAPSTQAPLPTESAQKPSATQPKQPKQQAPIVKPNQQQQQSGSNQPPPYHQQQRQNWQPNNRPPQQQPHRQPYNNRPFQQQQQPGGFNNQRQNNPRPFNRNAAPKEKLKFDNDYDFEKANEQFKEKLDVLTDDLAEKVAFTAETESNSEHENEDKEDSDAQFYNKKSSFFDSISCEAQEKAEGKNGRVDWRKERQTNTETFGQNAVRSHAYHYRNRFNNQSRFQGNRPQGAGQQGGPPRFNPRPNNNGAGQGYGNNKPRFNNRDQQQQQNPRQNRAF